MPYALMRIFIWPVYRLWISKINGLQNIPKNGPFIIAPNHASYFDIFLAPFIVLLKLNIRMHAWVNSSYWKNKVTKKFLDIWQCIPVFVSKEKGSKKKNNESFEKALNYLNKGDVMMIFPEGRRSPDGKLQKAYNGTARLALRAKAPVVPIGIIGASKVLPRGKLLPRFARCEVNIGEPLHFKEFYNKKLNDKILDYVTRKIMKKIAKLTRQSYNY